MVFFDAAIYKQKPVFTVIGRRIQSNEMSNVIAIICDLKNYNT